MIHSEKAYGKINLAMNILGRRPDGYHEVDTVYQSVSLHDDILFEASQTFRLSCSRDDLVCDETNLAYKAYTALLPFCDGPRPLHIHIDKHIPVAAGLAGGSADCAAVLRGLNRLWRLGLSPDTLRQIGRALGADVPFCINGGIARAGGIGEILVPLAPLPQWQVIILHPPVPVHTDKAYVLFDKASGLAGTDVGEMTAAVASKSFARVCGAMSNTFETLIMPHVPAVGECMNLLRRRGLRPLMTGSGPTVFALVPSDTDGEELAAAIENETKTTEVILTTLQ